MKKLSIVLTALVMLVLCGCSSTSVRTVILPGEKNDSGIETGRIYAFENLVPSNMTPNKFVGFDDKNNVVGWFTKGDDCCIMLFDVVSRVGQQIVNTDENVVNVEISGNGSLIYETSEQNTRSLYLVSNNYKTVELIAAYDAESSCIEADFSEDPRVFSVYRSDGKLKLLCVDTSDNCKNVTYDLTSVIENSAAGAASPSVRIKDIAVGEGGRVAVMVSLKDRYYMWTGILLKDGTFTDTIVMECEGTDHVFAGDSVFYADAKSSLMKLDPENDRQTVVMEDIDEFYVSSDENIAVCARTSGSVKRIYVKKTDSSPAALADIKQGKSSFMLNDDGTLLMTEHYDKTGAAKYSVMELGF